MRKITLLFLLCSAGWLHAQVSGYTMVQSDEVYTPVVGTSSTATGDDGSQPMVAIGFPFSFGGISYDSFSINVNGFIRLGNGIGGNSWVNNLSDAAFTPLIAAYWDDHNRTTGSIAYVVNGDAPNRVLEIGWDNINISTGGGTNTTNFGSFKMRLHEANGDIDLVYGSMVPGTGLSASVGLGDATTFLSVTPGLPSTVSNAAANNTVNTIAQLSGQRLTFSVPELCSVAPDPGASTATATAVCEGISFTLGLENSVAGFGISVQWQSSVDGVTFTDIASAGSATLTTTQTATTYYRAVVSCGANTATSTPILVTQTPPTQCYCAPSYTNGKTDGDLISNVQIAGTTLSNNTGTDPVNPYYTYFTGQPNYTATLMAGGNYTLSVSVGSYGQQEVAVWIDFDDDGVFETTEKVGVTAAQISGGGTGDIAIILGCDAPAGLHRMRIRDAWNTEAAGMDPCENYGYGETEDYDVTVVASTVCQDPYQLTATTTGSSASLSWAVGCGHTGWDVYVIGTHMPVPTADTVPTFANLTDAQAYISGLTPNSGYDFYVRAHCGDELTDWIGTAFVTAPAGIANDECEGGLSLTPGGSFEEHALTAVNFGASASTGAPTPTCGTFNFGGDVWFTAEVPADGNLTVETRQEPGSPIIDTAMMAFTGTCGNLTALGCSDDEGVDAFSMLNLTGLTPGSLVYIRVWEYANDTLGAFQVSAWNTSLGTKGFDDAALRAYPNPVHDLFQVSYDRAIESATVSNLIGQQVMMTTPQAKQFSLDFSALAQGTYFVKLQSEGQIKTLKVVKQ